MISVGIDVFKGKSTSIMSLKLRPPTEDTAAYDFMMKKEAGSKPKMVAKVAAMNSF